MCMWNEWILVIGLLHLEDGCICRPFEINQSLYSHKSSNLSRDAALTKFSGPATDVPFARTQCSHHKHDSDRTARIDAQLLDCATQY